ncbi:MAG TPA: peptide deformylase [Verrucomicrobiae bacterium]|nr:peptide deformylase [Verrucomicrobiae bacterium]
MILPIVQYGHPALRQKGARIEKITPEIRSLVADMFDTMYAAAGIGLAAQQVGRALQLTVLDVRGVKDRPSTLEKNGSPVEVAEAMPLVLINPVLRSFGDLVAGPEGCLSFPEIYEEITRPASVEVTALDAQGVPVQFIAGGLLGRAIQHEVDHVNGILFIDRMPLTAKRALKQELDALQQRTKESLAGGGGR